MKEVFKTLRFVGVLHVWGSGPGQVRSSCYPGVKISTEGHRRLGSSPSSSPATNAHTAFQSRASFLSAQNHPHLSISLFRSLSLCFFLTLPLCLHQSSHPSIPILLTHCLRKWLLLSISHQMSGQLRGWESEKKKLHSPKEALLCGVVTTAVWSSTCCSRCMCVDQEC